MWYFSQRIPLHGQQEIEWEQQRTTATLGGASWDESAVQLLVFTGYDLCMRVYFKAFGTPRNGKESLEVPDRDTGIISPAYHPCGNGLAQQ